MDTTIKQVLAINVLIPAINDRVAKQELGYKLVSNTIQSRLGNNNIIDVEDISNIYTLQEIVLRNNKFKGFGTLNNLYRQLLKLDLTSYKDTLDYATRLKGIYIDIINILLALRLETNFLIFLFYTNLGKSNKAYFTYYIQNHKAINKENTLSAFSLEYATQRFIQTVTYSSSNR